MDSKKGDAGSLRAVLKGLNLSEYVDLLEREDLDLEVLPDVKEEQLERIGVKTLGQRMKILDAANRAARSDRAMAKRKSTENSEPKLRENTNQEDKMEREDATATVVEGKTDEGKREEAEAGVEKNLEGDGEGINDKSSIDKNDIKIEDKFEKFLTNPKTSSGGGGFLKKKMPKDGNTSQKGTEHKSQTETKDKSQKETEGKIEEKFETFLKNQKASSSGGGFAKTTIKDPPGPDSEEEWKSPFGSSSDSSEDSSEDGMSTTGGLLYTAALIVLKMMEAK